jgi:hypothetical protein
VSRPSDVEVVYYIDRSLGSHDVPDALRQAGATVVAHDDEFDPATTDAEWLTKVGQRGWLVITKDDNIRRRRLEVIALRSAGVAAFILTPGSMKGADMGALLARLLPQIERVASKHTRPLIATITPSGTIRVIEGERKGGVRR